MLSNIVFYGALLYCNSCYAIVLFSTLYCPDDDDQMSFLLVAIRKSFAVRPLATAIFTFVVLPLLFLLLIPCVVPICAIQIYREGKQQAVSRRKHVDYCFIWKHIDNFPTEARRHVELRTPEFEEIGFRFEGTYQLKPEPRSHFGATFLNEHGTTIADVIRIENENFFGFVSVLESGRVIETTMIAETPTLLKLKTNETYTAVFATDQTVGSTYLRHQEKLAELYWSHGDRPLAFPLERVCDVLQYSARVHSCVLFELGERDAPPPAPVVPAGQPYEWSAPLLSLR